MKMMIMALVAILLVSGIAFADNQSNDDDSGRQLEDSIQSNNSDDNEIISNVSGEDGIESNVSEDNETGSNDSDEIDANESEGEISSRGSNETEANSEDSNENEIESNASDDSEANSEDNIKDSKEDNLGQQLKEVIRQRHVDQLNCNAQYILNVLDYMAANSDDTSAIDQAKADLTEGVNGLTTTSKKEYRSSVEEYRDAVSKVRSGMVGGVREVIGNNFKMRFKNGNGKNGNGSELKDFISEQKEGFRACFVNATRNRISAEVHLLQNLSNAQEDDMAKLGRKNISIDRMNKTLHELKDRMDELNSTSQDEDEYQVLKNKKQHMGEIRYLWIELHANKIGAILEKAKAFDVNGTYSSQIGSAQDLLDKCLSVGTDKAYDQAEYDEAKQSLVSAANDAKSIVKSLRGNKE